MNTTAECKVTKDNMNQKDTGTGGHKHAAMTAKNSFSASLSTSPLSLSSAHPPSLPQISLDGSGIKFALRQHL